MYASIAHRDSRRSARPGAGRRGVDMGPSAVRLAGLNAKLDIARLYASRISAMLPWRSRRARPPARENAKYLPQIAKTCDELAEHG